MKVSLTMDFEGVDPKDFSDWLHHNLFANNLPFMTASHPEHFGFKF